MTEPSLRPIRIAAGCLLLCLTAALFAPASLTQATVERWQDAINAPRKIAHALNGGPSLADNDRFGASAAAIGDLDGDGVSELAVGAYYDAAGGLHRGAVHILFLRADGTVKRTLKISHELNGGPTLADGDKFGYSVAGIGDLDGDEIPDLAVGARGDDSHGYERGVIYILFLNADGSARSRVMLAHELNGAPPLADWDFFGISIAPLGDLDGDSIVDLVAGAYGDSLAGSLRGAAYILFMNRDGTVRTSVKLAHQLNGGPTLANGDRFGYASAGIGDLDGDGVYDLAVGAWSDDTGGVDRGALYVLFLNADGTAKGHVKIANGINGGPPLANEDFFGVSVEPCGDLNSDGVPDLAVGAREDNTGGPGRGAFYLLHMNRDGTLRRWSKAAHDLNGGPTLANYDWFGDSLARIADLNGDGRPELAVGAIYDDTGGPERGAVYLFYSNRLPLLGNYFYLPLVMRGPR